MKRRMTTRLALVATVALLLVVGTPLILGAQTSESTTPSPQDSTQPATWGQCYQAMQSVRQHMVAHQQAMNTRLDQMMAEVRNSQGTDKTKAMEALLGELVDQTKSMHMMAMHGPMMTGGMYGMGMMGNGMSGMGMGHSHGMMNNCANCPWAQGTTPQPTPEKQPQN